jgi:hypothetical protein
MAVTFQATVFPDRFEMRCANAEKAITVLPVKIRRAQCLHEFGRILFDDFQNFRCGKFLCEIAQNVNVVRNTANRD